MRVTFRASSLVYIMLCQDECAGIQRISGKCQEDGVMLWISKALKCVLDCLSKHTVPDMNRRDKDAFCSTPSKMVRMSRLSGYLQKTSKKRTNREGSYHCSLRKHCSINFQIMARTHISDSIERHGTSDCIKDLSRGCSTRTT